MPTRTLMAWPLLGPSTRVSFSLQWPAMHVPAALPQSQSCKLIVVASLLMVKGLLGDRHLLGLFSVQGPAKHVQVVLVLLRSNRSRRLALLDQLVHPLQLLRQRLMLTRLSCRLESALCLWSLAPSFAFHPRF